MRAALTIAILGLISSLAFAQSDADTKEPKLPTEGRNGSFSRVIPIEVPAFRGLEPDLKLVYDSSSGIRNLPPAGGELGTGWTLQGVSAIQRISGTPAPMAGQNKAPSGRGVPAYGAAGFPTDSFALDGTELVPCTEVASPASTPSCATASSLQTAYSGRFETFMRIRANPSSNSWEVTSRDGVKSTYTSLEGGPSEVTFRWHLSSVTDRRGNHVDYGWNCAFGHCTISTIRAFSAGTGAPASEIVFHTQDRPDRITYGDGRGMRAMSKRITAIEIRSGGQLRGAYALGYETSASTRLSRLTEVRKYGVDAAISGGTVTGGTSLPPWRMSYTNNGDAAGHPVFDKRQDWTGPGIAALKPAKDFDSIGFPIDYPQSAELVGDFNGDGWDTDAYLPKLCIAATLPPVPNPRGGVGNPRPAYVCIENRLRLANGNPSGASFSLISIQSAKTAGKLPDSDRITALGDFNGDGATDFARAWSTAQEDCQSDQCARTWKFSGVTVKSLVGGGGGEGFGTVYDDVKMKSANGKAGDFDGDGKDDFLLEDGRIALSGRGRASVVNWGLNNIDSFGTKYRFLVGDFNGDGRADVLIHKLKTQSYQGFLSTGNGLLAQPAFSLPANTARHTLADVNGDANGHCFDLCASEVALGYAAIQAAAYVGSAALAAYAAKEAVKALNNDKLPEDKAPPATHEDVETIMGAGKDTADPGAKEKNISRGRPYKETVDKLKDLPGAEIKKQFETKWGKGEVITLPDKTKISARPGSEKTGEPTIEVTDPNGNTTKNRFPEDRDDRKDDRNRTQEGNSTSNESNSDSNKRLSDSDR